MTLAEFLRYAAATCVDGSSGRMPSRQPLPSLEEPTPGSSCPRCGYEYRVEGYCPECEEQVGEAREYLRADVAADSHSSDVDPGAER